MAQIKTEDFSARRGRVVDWLLPKGYADDQQLHSDQRAPGTCTWFLECREYSEWLETRSKVLFCSGDPGVGKTLLTSAVVSNLQQRFRPVPGRPKAGIAYAYFREHTVQSVPEDAVNQGPENLFKSLLGQILADLPDTQDAMPFFAHSWKLYDAHVLHANSRQPSLDDISDAFCKTAAWYDYVYVVLDALDECLAESRRFLSSLADAQTKRDLRIFATCRADTNIPQFHEGTRISRDIRASESDIRGYLKSRIPDLSRDFRGDQDLGQQVIQGITTKSNGSFLLARVYMDILATGTDNPSVLKEKLASFRPAGDGSTALYAAYDGIVDMINGQRSNQDGLAQRVLAAVGFAPLTLTHLQLRHALAITHSTGQLEDESKLHSVAAIISTCRGLLRVTSGGSVHLSHRTVGEYLRTRGEWLQEAHGKMAESCIAYLLFKDFSGGPIMKYQWLEAKELDELVRANLLLRYASSAWPMYLSRASHEVISRLLRRLGEYPDNLRLSFQVHTVARRRLFPKNVTITHIVSFMGSPDFIPVLKRDGCLDRRSKDSTGWTALHWAVCRQDGFAEDMVKKLLGFRFKINAVDEDARTPLSYVAKYGSPELARLLLEKKAKTETGGNSLSPLAQACACGHAKVVQVLLDHGAKVNAKSGPLGQTPLAAAIAGDSEECVAVVLAHPRLKKHGGKYEHGTALHQAAYYNSAGVVKKLLDAGFDVNSRTADNTTPLQAAVAGAHMFTRSKERTQVVKLLLERGADVNAESGQFGTALDAALRTGNMEVEELLRNCGATNWTKEFAPVRRPSVFHASKDPFLWDAIGRYGGHYLASVAVGNDKQIQQHIDMKVGLFKTAIQKKDMRSIRFHTDFSVMAFDALVRQAKHDMEREEAIRNGGQKSRSRMDFLMACIAPIAPILNFIVWRRVPGAARNKSDEAFHATSSAAAKLDLITSAAVRILSDAIEDGDERIVLMLSRSWVDALKNMFTNDVNGNMVQELVTNRAKEFEGFFRDGEMEKANLMAKLALELMSAAIQGSKMNDTGKEREKLAHALSEIWSLTLRNVAENGSNPSESYPQLEAFFQQIKNEIADEIEKGNWSYIRRVAPSCVEVLASLVADNNVRAADMVARLIVEGWQLADDQNMRQVDETLIHELEQEFKDSIKSLSEDSGASLEKTRPWVLAGALFKVLYAAVRCNSAPIKRNISQLILSNLSTLYGNTSPQFATQFLNRMFELVPVWCEADENPVYLLEAGLAVLSAFKETGYYASYSEEDTRRAIVKALSEPSEVLTGLETRVRDVLLAPARRDDAGRIKDIIQQLRGYLGPDGDKILPGMRSELASG
ncbi:hypothetical protein B0H67DRAFT_685700 [Lasiosphaeris hirsuta]|uniref:Nephrocystin 3-like N-terminal domain-containing protein n=1 Tax=Lasiosphaeris hirsuta TaxID=260670 RepID=A0AA40A151_9PEZI|nr:hypothetical protein B0H67DRAFT_685700 [Lasiosphaeris hirsuta]